MRFKNFTLLSLMGIFGLFSTNLFAQEDATIDPADIRYWIGEGENDVVFIVNWNEPDTALAWGYRFDGETVIVKDMMAAIAAADHRFAFEGESFVNDITFNDGILDLKLTENGYFMYNVNGTMAMEYFNAQTVADGDYVKWGDTNCGTIIDPENWVYVWEKPVAAVYPLAQEAMIDPSEILYWVGEGAHEAIFCVNWNGPDTALAWGYRFDGESIVLKDLMDGIAEADKRFAYEASGTMLTNLTFSEGDIELGLTGAYFMYNINGAMAMLGFSEQTIADGDFIKWGDESCATEIAQWTYVWTQEVHPVSVYTGMNESLPHTLAVYPNPADNEACLTIDNAGLNTVSVYDVQGRLVIRQTYLANAGEQVRLSTGTMVGGVYFVSVANERGARTAKLVVK